MPETNKAAEIFTLAKRAAWAGDVEYCRARLAQLREVTRRRRQGSRWDPLALLGEAGAQIEAHLADKDAPPDELIIETVQAHLRGVVWQVGRREFELLAYLVDYWWEEALYRYAVLAAKTGHGTILESEEDDTIEREEVRQDELFPLVEHETTVSEGPGMSWEEDANGLQCVVTVGDLGLIKVKGLWVSRGLPQGAGEVVLRFRGILDRIESPGG